MERHLHTCGLKSIRTTDLCSWRSKEDICGTDVVERREAEQPAKRAGAREGVVGPRGAEELRPRRAHAQEEQQLRRRAQPRRDRDAEVDLDRRRHAHDGRPGEI